MHNYYNHSEK